MLVDLSIKNIAIIETLHVSFRPGLTILTGETGAGKSIIIDAITLILGERASADLIRTGEEEATIEAVFDLTDRPDLVARLAESGIDDARELLIKRVLTRSGRNRIFLNGSLATAAILTTVSRELINIYGQHEAQTLLKPENHLLLLDRFAGLADLRTAFTIAHAERQQTLATVARLEEDEREMTRRLEILSFQSSEIGNACLAPDEEDELSRERELLIHGEKLFTITSQAFDSLYSADKAILGSLATEAARLGEIVPIDQSLLPMVEELRDVTARLEAVSLFLRDYAGRIEINPTRLAEVDERLEFIRQLKRKYNASVEEIIANKVKIDADLAELRDRERIRTDLDGILVEQERILATKGAELSQQRQEAARELKHAMERELATLAMTHALFDTAIETLATPRSTGRDRVEFIFSPNPGEDLKPLARIASGGELSRLMLAMKQVMPENDVPSLIFDEVDSGIGGPVSALVGEKLKRVARLQQVLCITHLPQIAAWADHHFRVGKRIDGGRTTVSVKELSGEERIEETARMLGGVTISPRTFEHAKEMIAEAQHQSAMFCKQTTDTGAAEELHAS